MAQLKSTSVTGNLSATGNIIASQIIKNGGTEDQLLKANGETQSLKAITDDISDNTTAITTLKGEKSGGGLPETSNDSTITVANALKRANDAYDLADTKTTMSAVESKGYATKNEAQGYANAVLGDDKDTNADKTVYGAFAAAAAAHAAADSANTNANNRVPTSGDTTIAGKLTADQFIGPLQGYARYLETKKQDKAGGGWYGSEYNFYTQWDEDTNSICELKTVGNYDTRATRAFEDADGNVISSTYLKLNGNQLSNSTSTYDKVLVANNNKLGYRTKAELRTDLDLATAYFYKGTLADINALKNITSANIGDVYFISETKDSWACKQVVDEPYGSGDYYENYWSNLGKNIDLSGYMTLNTDQTITGQKTFNSIYATTFNGNATSASQFSSAQSITLTGDVTGTASSVAGWSITTSLPARLKNYQNSSYAVSDANNATETGFYYMASTSEGGGNRPPFANTTNDYRILTTAYSADWLQQIATNYRSNEIFFRRRDNDQSTKWTPWVQIQTTESADARYTTLATNQTITGKKIFVAPSTGASTITSDVESLIITNSQQRIDTVGSYLSGIAFNHMWNWSGGATYNTSSHAWIGLRLVSTPAAETSALVFATRSNTTAGERPIERMCVAPDGKIGIGTTNPTALLEVNGNIQCESIKLRSVATFEYNTDDKCIDVLFS